MTETIENEVHDAVVKAVDEMLLSNYKVRLNLILRLQTEELEEPTLYQAPSGDVFSLAFPFTGVQVRLNPNDKEPTKAKGFLSSHLIKVMQAIENMRNTPVLRLGKAEDAEAFYKGLGTHFHRLALETMTDEVPQMQSVAELSKPEEEEDLTQNYTIDIYYCFTVSGEAGFANLEKWTSKVLEKSDKFVVPFRFTVAVPFDDLQQVMGDAASGLARMGFEYSHTSGVNPPTPLFRSNAMVLLGKIGDGPVPHALFTKSFG